MRLLVITDPHVPVPPGRYGGTERVADLLCRGLVAGGHRVRLLAAPGSRDFGGGLLVHRPAGPGLASRAARKLAFQWLLRSALRDIDLVVNFGRIDYLAVLYRTRIPAIHWLQNPLNGREVDYVRRRRPAGDRFVAVSRAQVASSPHAAAFEVVPNALELDAVPFSPQAAAPPYALFLGRLTRNKGVHLAIAAARAAGVPLVIGGNVPAEPGATEYFATEIRPHLGPGCRWHGPYTDAERNALLAGAVALLFPIQWDEPFGLVMIEALAAGVPVVAARRASTPEVVEHGRTGFLCDSVEEMAAALGRVGTLDRAHCRAAAAARFSAAAFQANVERLLTGVAA